MKKLKCESCGGDIYITQNKEFAVCPYCDTKYKLNEDNNIYIKLDEDTKKAIGDGVKTVGKGIGFAMIPAILIFLIIVGVIVLIGINVFRQFNRQSSNILEVNDAIDDITDDNENIYDKAEEIIKKTYSESEKSSFNSKFEMRSGTRNLFFVKFLLEDVVTSNKKNPDRLVTIIYDDKSTTDSDEIVNIKHSLPDGDYEVKIDYDEDGFVNIITLEKL